YFCVIATSTTEIYTLSLHDALPIYAIGNLAQRIRQRRVSALIVLDAAVGHKHSDPLVSAAREVRIPTTYAHKGGVAALARAFTQDRKSTRLNSSHVKISYAVFCLKK